MQAYAVNKKTDKAAKDVVLCVCLAESYNMTNCHTAFRHPCHKPRNICLLCAPLSSQDAREHDARTRIGIVRGRG